MQVEKSKTRSNAATNSKERDLNCIARKIDPAGALKTRSKAYHEADTEIVVFDWRPYNQYCQQKEEYVMPGEAV